LQPTSPVWFDKEKVQPAIPEDQFAGNTWVGTPEQQAQAADDANERSDNTLEGYDGNIVDGGDEMIQAQTEPSAACSCDCCQVQKLLPTNFIRQPGGQQITSMCFKESSNLNEDSSSLCPSQCQVSNSNQVLTSAKGAVDYSRFCTYQCRPVTDAIGTSCVTFSGDLYAQASNVSLGGNGVDIHPAPVLGINSGFEDPLAQAVQVAGPVEAAAAAAAAPEAGSPEAAAAAQAAPQAAPPRWLAAGGRTLGWQSAAPLPRRQGRQAAPGTAVPPLLAPG